MSAAGSPAKGSVKLPAQPDRQSLGANCTSSQERPGACGELNAATPLPAPSAVAARASPRMTLRQAGVSDVIEIYVFTAIALVAAGVMIRVLAVLSPGTRRDDHSGGFLPAPMPGSPQHPAGDRRGRPRSRAS